jgi:hypothetical protein
MTMLSAKSGELSLGPMVRCQRIRPVSASKAITFPSTPWEALHGGLFRSETKTRWLPTAGEAAEQRCERYFQTTLPVAWFRPKTVPELLTM